MASQIGLEFGLKDFFYSAGFLLALYNAGRSYWKDRVDPVRQDMLRSLDELVEITSSCTEEAQRYMEKGKGAKAYSDLLRHEKACQRKLQLIGVRLPNPDSDKLMIAEGKWWRAHTEDPWGRGSARRKASPVEIAMIAEAHTTFLQAVEDVRQRVLCGSCKAIRAS
jgi:hypothetical protein